MAADKLLSATTPAKPDPNSDNNNNKTPGKNNTTSNPNPSPSPSPSKKENNMTDPEHRDLRRVFDHLAVYCSRMELSGLVEGLSNRMQKLSAFVENPNSGQVVQKDGVTLSKFQAQNELKIVSDELSELKQTLKKLVDNPNKMISLKDLDMSLRSLGRNCTKKELEYMIWEVDENLDQHVSWDEFVLMFTRNTNDVTGLEPFMLFNIVQFMTYDEDFKGHITEDDTMSTLFARHGRENLESQMVKLFGDQLKSAGGEGILTLEQYLRAVSVRQVQKKKIEYTITTSVKKTPSGTLG